MSRAYRNTVSPLEPIEQLDLGLFPEAKGAVPSTGATQLRQQLRIG